MIYRLSLLLLLASAGVAEASAHILVYSLAVSPPVGWKEVPRSICKRVYHMNLDGMIIHNDDGRTIVRANCFQKNSEHLPRAYRSGEGPSFGAYTRAYADRQQAKRWRELCKGAGRYQAMSEAYEAGKPDPCNKN